VWHWNIAGQKINKGSTTNEMTKVATDSILNRKAELVSFNEICESQYRDIKNRLDKASWSTKKNFHTFVTTNPTGCGKDNAYGNAIFIKNGIDDVRRNTLQNDGKKEVRAIVCGLVSNTKDRFCSTHISTSNEEIDGAPINVQQLNRVRSILDTFYNSGERVVIAGDFNAQPHYGRMNSWYASSLSVPNNSSNKGVYREVDDNDSLYCIGYGESTTADGNNEGICGGDKKIDMIFFRDNQVASYNGDSLAVSRTCGAKKNQACSDHRILIGTLTFKAVGQNNTPGGVSPSR
ncbi:MAG: endonuclease/exonuclease/phosphatase family protein, partial [Candidatus Saccharimonas sp.]